MTGRDVAEAITRAHREEWARVVATLARQFGDLDVAEDAAAEAFTTAVERWPADGVPPNPGGWLTTTARRKALDRVRREGKRADKQKQAQMSYDDSPHEPVGAVEDERLRLVFTCCHPALAPEARVALTLRMVGGLTVPEIARAFLVQESTMGQRITRAKAKIKAARIPYRVPYAEDLPARVSGVLAVLFLVFNEGYLSTDPDADPVRADLTAEAIRLTRLLRELLPDDGEVAGLLALMLLTEARREARVSAGGELVTLDQQDRETLGRSRWSRRGTGWCGSGWPVDCLRVATRSWPRSTRCTPRPAAPTTPTGRRSWRSTTSSCASTRPRSSPSTGRSRWRSSTDPTSPWRWSTPWPTRSPATTPTTRPGPTCSAGPTAVTTRERRTTAPSRSPATPPRRRT